MGVNKIRNSRWWQKCLAFWFNFGSTYILHVFWVGSQYCGLTFMFFKAMKNDHPLITCLYHGTLAAPWLLVSSMLQVWCVVDPIPWKVLILWPLLERLGNFYRKGNWNSHPTMKWFDEVVKPYAGMKIKWPTNNPPNIPKLISKILHEHVCSQCVVVGQISYAVENCVKEPVYTVQS
jgi:hypothetical protein